MPTALELTPTERKRYTGPGKMQSRARELNLEERQSREQLLFQVRAAVAILKKQFPWTRVVLFGSLAHAVWFHSDSDIDIAVEGLDGQDYWKAWRLLEDSIRERPIDLVQLETASEVLKRSIERYGFEL